MKLIRAVIFTLVLSEKLSRFNTLSWSLAFLHTFETSYLKVRSLYILMPDHMIESSFSKTYYFLFVNDYFRGKEDVRFLVFSQ